MKCWLLENKNREETMEKLNRRAFVCNSAGAMVAGLSLAPNLFGEEVPPEKENPDISIVQGRDYFKNTIKAVEQLGGIQKFIKKGDRVGLLANSSYKKPATYTHPEVLLAIAFLCKEAGAKVYSFKGEKENYWRRSQLSEKHKSLIAAIKEDESDHKTVKNPKAKIVKQPDVLAGYMDYDKVINIPIVKNHGEIHLTCTLKNTMGISAFTTNIKFHTGKSIIKGAVKMIGDPYHNMENLAQCIADLNLTRKWDLCIVDATEFIATNGPSGPGKIIRENKVVVSADPVAAEAFCGRYLNLEPHESIMVKKAHKNGLGRMDIDKLNIKETTI
jgi:uncharacterized protein (DUF362 family)